MTQLTERERRCVRETAELVAEQPDELAQRLYQRFFERHPSARALFRRDSQADQVRMLEETLIAALDHVDEARWLLGNMESCGHRHDVYEVTAPMYEWFSACLVETLAESLRERWSADHERAWRKVLDVLCAMMRRLDDA